MPKEEGGGGNRENPTPKPTPSVSPSPSPSPSATPTGGARPPGIPNNFGGPANNAVEIELQRQGIGPAGEQLPGKAPDDKTKGDGGGGDGGGGGGDKGGQDRIGDHGGRSGN